MKYTTDELLEVIDLHKRSGFNYRERRHDEWTQNYTLYRDKVNTNRLTQRQTANIPLMKYALKTLIKDIDDMPVIYFTNLDNDTQKEVFYNEYWKQSMLETKLAIKDIVDKMQAMLFGRSFKKLNIVNGKFDFEVIDPQDILIDRFVDPAKMDTARFLVHEHIYKPLASLEEVEAYDKAAVKRLIKFYQSEDGLLDAEENAQNVMDKAERLQDMGVDDVLTPQLGETYIELNEIYMYLPCSDSDGEDILHLIVVADGKEILLNKPLCEVLGNTHDNYWHNHFPFVSWGVDVERTDFWNDGIGDILRQPNVIINSWFSQMVENRTLRNFGMHYYDSSNPDFVPQTFTPVPWGWYPTPGDPSKTVMKVDVPALTDGLTELQFLLGIAEKASAATSSNQGQVEKSQVTLGEVELALANAKERVKSMEVFYKDGWTEFGHKYIKMLEGAQDLLDETTIYKKGRVTDKVYTKKLTPQDWFTKNGYRVEVKHQADRVEESVEAIQKLQAVKAIMPNNRPLDEIFKKKAAEFAGLNAEEIHQVIEYEKQLQKDATEMALQDMEQQDPNNPESPENPPESVLPNDSGGVNGMRVQQQVMGGAPRPAVN